MNYPVIKGSSYILVHTPNILKQGGSTQTTTRAKNPDDEYLTQIDNNLRKFDDFVAYAPNQVYIGNITPDKLEEIDTPWYSKENLLATNRYGELGEIMPEDEFFILLKYVDVFDLVILSEEFSKNAKGLIEDHPILSEMDIELGSGEPIENINKYIEEHAEPLYLGDKLAGCIKQAHKSDINLSSHVILENLVSKASAVLALKNLAYKNDIDLTEVDYILECSEEACGDINQRGGGNFAKSIGEMAGCTNATGSDVRSFCAGPAHAMVNAAALVKSEICENVVVVAGGSVAKLGMNGKDHVKNNIPILEDGLGGFAILVSKNDGVNPVIRTDIVGRHSVGTGSSPQAVISSLVTDPLEKNGISIKDIDKYSVEMQNPEITKPAGAGNVPEANYKMIAALGVKKGELERKELMDFVNSHGMPGFAPTQGHIPSGVPFIGHARQLMSEGKLNRAMIIGKGSLFLGRMTNLFDGVSFVIEKNSGKINENENINDKEIKNMIAEAMRDIAENMITE
ncbi:glycine/sarcosine/betaine reductase complex component C subunit beta [Halocella sp. SP3-1]|uniref:glycine/sarcosine/betaine reductase complex component C subunit beta n=1 Tax=Halocella sp. SP3-1 TaxID=2382161 RepID=UPI000F765463|nr:glycine/sarcosine/betaine reductase complex component C subunit beta [Halocella sp. SP3-1]AZO94740.1 glycine reductase [Halocella sp. SP3-1]